MKMAFKFEIPSKLNKIISRIDCIADNTKAILLTIDTKHLPTIGNIKSIFLYMRQEIRTIMKCSLSLFILHFVGFRTIKLCSLLETIALNYIEKIYQFKDAKAADINRFQDYTPSKSLHFLGKKYHIDDAISIDFKSVVNSLNQLSKDIYIPSVFNSSNQVRVIGHTLKTEKNENMLRFLRLLVKMLTIDMPDPPNFVKDKLKMYLNDAMIKGVYSIAKKLGISVNIFRYVFDYKWEPIELIKFGNDCSCVNILLSKKDGCLNEEDVIYLLYPKEECIASVIDDYESDMKSINLINSFKDAIMEPKETNSNAITDYSLSIFELEKESTLKKDLSYLQTVSQYPSGLLQKIKY